MRPYRRIDAAVGAGGRALEGGVIERLAHAVQTLELERAIGGVGQFEDGADGVCVVGGELREDPPTGAFRKQEVHADQVADVGVRLAGEYRVAVDAELLGLLDLGIPVGALDQA